MFTDHKIESVNLIESLPDGVYAGARSLYQLPGAEKREVLVDLWSGPDSDHDLRVIDITVVESEGALSFRDFMLTQSGDWRDSYGARSEDVFALMPPEILDLQPQKEWRLPSIQMRAGKRVNT